MKQGLIYIFTGDGKGKTSAALGVALRAVSHGQRVAMVQWYKQRSSPGITSSKSIPSRLEIYPMGRGFYLGNSKFKVQNSKFKAAVPLKTGGVVVNTATKEQHRQAAQAALRKVQELLAPQPSSHSSHLFLLILDEVLNAVNDRLIPLSSLISLISQRGPTHLILTGRNAPKKLIDLADLVTKMKKIKHPFDRQKPAVQGLDF